MKLALIPARRGSKRIPEKNVKEFNGAPLVSHSIALALFLKDAGAVDQVAVSTNCSKVEQVVGVAHCLRRPDELCQDDSTDLGVIRHALGVFAKYNTVVYLRPTTPMRQPGIVKEAIRWFDMGGDSITGLRSVHESPESYAKWFTLDNSRMLAPLTSWSDTEAPGQSLTPTWIPNGYVDICKREVVLNPDTPTPWGLKVVGYPTVYTFDLDTPFQWELAEIYNKYGKPVELRYRSFSSDSEQSD